nr:nucleotide exchange factor GrpE [Pseudactinotalea sp. HY160]
MDPVTGELREGGAAAAGGATAPGAAGAEDAAPESEELATVRAEALDLADDLARAKADLYNLDQRFNTYVQRSKADAADAFGRGQADAVEALIPVLDDIELARRHDELHGPFASIAEKLETTLSQRYRVERFGQVGEEFDPTVHEALMHRASEDVATDVIDVVMQPGYRVGDRVVRPARVGVAGPE